MRPRQPLANFPWKHNSILVIPSELRISYYAALITTTYAAFGKESRMKSTETTKPVRKSGGSRGTCCAPVPNATAKLCPALSRRVGLSSHRSADSKTAADVKP